MTNKFHFLKSNIFINLISFFFIIVVFLNYIHNNIDPYKKINIDGDNETFVLLKSSEIKKELSQKLISNDAYNKILNRECEITGDFHDRHKVRWVKAIFLKSVFSFSSGLNEQLPYYVNIILHSLIIFLTLLILNKTFSLDRKYNLIFLLYFTFIFQQHLSEYSYSIFETFFLTLALYASKNKKHLLFFLSCLLATLNRESGFLIIFSWLIFNNNEYKKLIIFLIVNTIIFVALNFDIIKCLLEPRFFVPLEDQKGQVNFSELLSNNFISTSKLIFVNFLLPFGIGIFYLIQTTAKNKILITLFFIYLLMFIFATPAHHISVRLIILPLIFASIYFYYSERKFNQN